LGDFGSRQETSNSGGGEDTNSREMPAQRSDCAC